ncbi:MAG TPA: PAS domain S-box protein, partial [Calditrichia bacterium]|nr:PAS domain S-box protein [Calditrichia bacterium]
MGFPTNLLLTIAFLATAGLTIIAVLIYQMSRSSWRVGREERMLQAVLKASPAMILAWDNQQIIRVFNLACENCFGLSHAEVVGKGLREVGIFPEKFLAELNNGIDFPFRLRTERHIAAGNHRKIDWMINHLKDEELGLNLEIAAGQDITRLVHIQEDLESHREILRAMNEKLSQQRERQRRDIAEQLHSGAGQTLVTAKIILETLLKDPALGKDQKDKVGQAVALLHQVVQANNAIIFEISPRLLYDVGLVDALEALTRTVAGRHQLKYDFSALGQIPRVSEPAALLVYRACQELLHNAVKYARATELSVQISFLKGCLELVVSDDGIGVKPEKIIKRAPRQGGFGLYNIRSRLNYYQGE